jgi:tetratricopeptide (TPR) repeat protein
VADKLAAEYAGVAEYRWLLAEVHDNLGGLLADAGRPAAAEPLIHRALSLKEKLVEECPAVPAYRVSLALSLAACPLARLRDAGGAVRQAKRAVEELPRDGRAWTVLGAAHYRAGDWKAARAALDRARELRRGGDAALWLWLAMTCRQQGEPGPARQWYDRAAGWVETHNPRDREVRRLLAEAAALLDVAPPATRP